MKKISIIILAVSLLSCKEQGNREEVINCSNTTVIVHDDIRISFCLPEYLSRYRIDTLYEAQTEYNYSLISNPLTDNGFMKPIKYEDSLYINFRIMVDGDDSNRHLLPQKRKYLPFLIEKKEPYSPIKILDSSYAEKENAFVYNLEWMCLKEHDQYEYEKIYFMKKGKYAFSFLFHVRNIHQAERNIVLML
ncbi:MAG: hypothetical protein JKY51_04805 [Opitutaceae bacterium]|nr:hypothetical protein [Opitutaceae bacterium]